MLRHAGCGYWFARHVAQLKEANSTEFDPKTSEPVVAMVTEWVDASGDVLDRNETSDLGGTMRLGEQLCHLTNGSKTAEIYGGNTCTERHRHRYEVNNHYVDVLEKAGLVISARSTDKSLVEMIELPEHPWFVAGQFHPELTSTPRDGHPLFESFISASKQQYAKTKLT